MKLFGRDIDIVECVEMLDTKATREKGRRGRLATIDELLPLLCDPMSKAALSLDGEQLVGGERPYRLVHGNPVLFPFDIDVLLSKLGGRDVLATFPTLPAVEQYAVFGILKASGNNNLDHSDVWYKRHIYRASKLLQDASGVLLDIGCDDAFLSRGMHHVDVQYIGLEPSPGLSQALRVGGLGEFLPFRSQSMDGISFQTSLDHMLDYHLAISEAKRVLRPRGRLYLATLLWLDKAQLFTDTVHFHHFRPKQLEAALEGFEVDKVDCYVWKDGTHRFGAYLSAVKV